MKTSRGWKIDMQKCAEIAGGRYELVLIGSQQCRESRKQQIIYGDPTSEHITPVTTLLEIQNGNVRKEFLTSLGKKK